MPIQKLSSKDSVRKVALNTTFLSLLSFSSYFLALITLPYQSRVLGPELFGMVGFAMTFGIYFQLLIDFGFTLSATEKISKKHYDKEYISSVVSVVTWNKAALTTLSLVALAVLSMTISPFDQYPLLYILFALSYTLISLTPDYFYRGVEDMKTIAIRTVLIRLVFIGAIFIFLKEPGDYLAIPALLALGNLIALLYTAWDLHRRGIRLKKSPLKEFLSSLKQSSLFFYSRVATNIYSASNTFVIGTVYGPLSTIVGFFTSADKLTSAAKFSLNPLIDSLYPHMVKNKDFRMVKKVLLLFTPITLCVSAAVWLLAYEIVAIIFGEDFRPAGEYLRWLIPTALIAFPSMVLGYPTLSPLGLAKYANTSVIIGSVTHILLLIVFYFTGSLNIISVCIATILTETCVLLIRIVVLVRYRKGV